MKKESRRCLCIILVVFSCIFLCICVMAYFILGPIKPWERKKLYNYYSVDSNYVTVKGKIVKDKWADETFFSVQIDVEAYRDKYDEWRMGNYVDRPYFEIRGWSIEVLEENGFFDVMEEKEFEVITSFYIWWDGWNFPIVGIRSEETIYLDYETGKENLLNWIQNDLN